MRSARSASRSSSMTSSVARAAAQATALPPYVPPWAPAEPVQEIARGQDPRQRQPRGDALGHHHDVRPRIGPFGREEAARCERTRSAPRRRRAGCHDDPPFRAGRAGSRRVAPRSRPPRGRLHEEAATSSGETRVANKASIARMVVARAGSAPPRRSGYGNGAKWTPVSSGSKWARYLTLEEVSAMAPWVRPWKPPRNTTKVRRPVAILASFIVASIASAPEFERNSP